MCSAKTPITTADKDFTIAVAKGRSPSSVEMANMGKQPLYGGGTVGFASSALNLIKTIMGTGMLVLPFAFQAVSLIPAIILLIVAGIGSGLGLYLLTCAALRVSGGRNSDFASLAQATYPRLTPLFDLAVLLKCLGVAMGYFVVIGQISPKLMGTIFTTGVPSLLANPVFWISIGALAILPVVFMPRMDSLKYTSFLGMISIVYMVGLSVVLYFFPVIPFTSSIQWWAPPSALALVKNFGVFVFAFTCHQNMLPIQNEARKNGQRDMLRIIGMCVALATLMYIIFGTFNLAIFGARPIPDNLILAYPQSGLCFVLARFLYVFLVLFSIPLQTFPARNSTSKIIAYYSPLLVKSREKEIYYGSTILIFATCWILACTGLNLNFLLRLVGSTAGPILCYVLPSLFWFSLESAKPWGTLKISTVVLLVFGLASLVICTTALFL